MIEACSTRPTTQLLCKAIVLLLPIKRCAHCRKTVGLRQLIGAAYCSDAHKSADIQQMQLLMIERLHRSAARLRYSIRMTAPPEGADKQLFQDEHTAVSAYHTEAESVLA
jgi:hypothetical protein